MQKNNSYLFTPKSGRGVLPEEAQIALFAIDSLQLKDYTFYGSLGDYEHADDHGIELYQRINESAWPIKMDTLSRNLIGYTHELGANPNIKIVLQFNHISVGTY